MTDRELLEMAAKAAGVPVEWDGDGFVRPVPFKGFTNYEPWNPLADDGDALRLAVKSGLWAHIGKYYVAIDGTHIEEACGQDPYAATRRAIVRAAAEIGKAM